MLKLLSGFVHARGLKKSKVENKAPFIVSVTIDTESGFVDKNDHRVWQKSNPSAYIGFYKGIENWRSLLSKYNVKATFFLSTNCFSADGEDYSKIIKQLRLLIKEGHEIGLHMHPDSDLALQSLLGKRFNATSAKFYNEKEINYIIAAGKNLIKKHLKISATSFRWGNWALNEDAVKALQKNGFRIDSSATPEIKGHQNDSMAYDWSKVIEHYPWRLSRVDYQDTKHQNSKIVEIPIATFNFFGLKLRADPANSALLAACFDCYYKNAERSKPFIFVVISHSIEGTHQDGSKTKVIGVMDEFLSHAKKFRDVRFSTLDKARK
ncbi:polysaccharide deacetylase family protein [Candidatus Woesearchaeota archaeon]|nr:polysaccharide deacetylase family protein [Candidatus Woesearchaeota archaeon]